MPNTPRFISRTSTTSTDCTCRDTREQQVNKQVMSLDKHGTVSHTWDWTPILGINTVLRSCLIDWLIIYSFTSTSWNFDLYGDVTIANERLQKLGPMLSAQDLWAGRDLYRATPAVTWDLGFSRLIWRTAPFSRLLRYMRGCGGFITSQILMGCLV
jgi:hypothetical protein